MEGGEVLTAAYKTDNWYRPNGIVTLKHEGRGDGKPFYGVIQLNRPWDAWAWIKIYICLFSPCHIDICLFIVKNDFFGGNPF